MPYIKPEDRYQCDIEADTPGELNYLISMHCKDFLVYKGESYETINAIIGVLECAKIEFYRRIAVMYEEAKKAQNGDVY